MKWAKGPIGEGTEASFNRAARRFDPERDRPGWLEVVCPTFTNDSQLMELLRWRPPAPDSAELPELEPGDVPHVRAPELEVVALLEAVVREELSRDLISGLEVLLGCVPGMPAPEARPRPSKRAAAPAPSPRPSSAGRPARSGPRRRLSFGARLAGPLAGLNPTDILTPDGLASAIRELRTLLLEDPVLSRLRLDDRKAALAIDELCRQHPAPTGDDDALEAWRDRIVEMAVQEVIGPRERALANEVVEEALRSTVRSKDHSVARLRALMAAELCLVQDAAHPAGRGVNPLWQLLVLLLLEGTGRMMDLGDRIDAHIASGASPESLVSERELAWELESASSLVPSLLEGLRDDQFERESKLCELLLDGRLPVPIPGVHEMLPFIGRMHQQGPEDRSDTKRKTAHERLTEAAVELFPLYWSRGLGRRARDVVKEALERTGNEQDAALLKLLDLELCLPDTPAAGAGAPSMVLMTLLLASFKYSARALPEEDLRSLIEIEKDPRSPAPYLALAETLARRGDPAAARRILEDGSRPVSDAAALQAALERLAG